MSRKHVQSQRILLLPPFRVNVLSRSNLEMPVPAILQEKAKPPVSNISAGLSRMLVKVRNPYAAILAQARQQPPLAVQACLIWNVLGILQPLEHIFQGLSC